MLVIYFDQRIRYIASTGVKNEFAFEFFQAKIEGNQMNRMDLGIEKSSRHGEGIKMKVIKCWSFILTSESGIWPRRG
jgi:CRISPR/Cas system-associated protein Cas7 (RAMP superfamily)